MLSVESLRCGVVVRLISGSPKMTVERVERKPNGEHRVHLVVWSDRLGLQRFALAPEQLVWPRPAPEPEEADA